MGRFRKFVLIFFNSRVINMLFLFTSLSKLPSGRVLKINIIMMGVVGGRLCHDRLSNSQN